MPDTPTDRAAPGARLVALWRRLSPLPGGRWLFNRILFRAVPYSGTTGARVVALEPGRAEVRLRDRRGVRNHLRSIHAVALANVGELASGLAVLSALPPDVRGIVVRLEVDFLKKARGTVTAASAPEIPGVRAGMDHTVAADVRDEEGDVVARVTAIWRLDPVEGPRGTADAGRSGP